MAQYQDKCPACGKVVTVQSVIACNSQVIVRPGDESALPDGFILFNKTEQACDRCKQAIMGVINGGVFSGFSFNTPVIQAETGAMWAGESYIPVVTFNYLINRMARIQAKQKGQEAPADKIIEKPPGPVQ